MAGVWESPLQFLVVGLNHRTAPVEVREKLSLTKSQLPGALAAMRDHSVPGVILCTCNRSEFYTLEPDGPPKSPAGMGVADSRVKEFLVDHFHVPMVEVERYLYLHRDKDCVQHLFRVASSLDSMILGEEQVIGQVREAFEAAVRAETVPGPLSHLFQQAFRVGRRVRRETGIGRNAMSISRACAELAKETLGGLAGRRVMVVGAGDAAGLAAEVLSLSGVDDIVVTSRTYQRAEELARDLSGQAIPFQDMGDALRSTDMVIGCTGSPGYVLDASTVRTAMSRRPERPLFLIDIAVPRDIEPAAGDISNVFLHDLDDLEIYADASRQDHRLEAQSAELLVSQETERFVEWCLDLEVLPTLVALRTMADRIREGELNKTLKKLDHKLTTQDLASLDAMTRAIVNKLLHGPTVYLKGQRSSGGAQVAKEFFRLADDDASSGVTLPLALLEGEE